MICFSSIVGVGLILTEEIMEKIITFIVANQEAIAFGVWAVLCEVFAFNKKAQSNSVLQAIFNFAKGKKKNFGE